MIINLRRQVKKALNKKIVPAFIYSIYFKYQLKRDERRLSALLAAGKDLMTPLTEQVKQHWSDRIVDVIRCPDNEGIPRHALAGTLAGDLLIMHNGLKVSPLSYYDFPVLKMLMQNRGVHEPQEEKVFLEVLKSLAPDRGKTILELGAYWSFYSLWFKSVFPDAGCYMVEPVRRNLFFGKENFKINGLKGTFIHAGIGKSVYVNKNITTVDTICRQQRIAFLDILHSDIQGFELEMLEGSKQMLSEKRVGYVFISTHSNELHDACRQLLAEEYHFQTVATANLDETYSWDGILVMKSPDYPGVSKVNISKKRKGTAKRSL